MKQDMVIFTRTYDFVRWLIPQTINFPRSQRFVITKRLQDSALNFYELIIEANGSRGKQRMIILYQADINLDKVRHYLRLSHNWGWLSPGQNNHAVNFVSEIGKLLGGWIKQTSN